MKHLDGAVSQADLQKKADRAKLIIYVLMIFIQNGNNLLLNRGTINETGILDPIEFWWVP